MVLKIGLYCQCELSVISVNCAGLPRWHQVGKCDGDKLELVVTYWLCQLQTNLPPRGFCCFC